MTEPTILPTDREFQIMRLIHGGARLFSVTRSAATLALPCTATVRPALLVHMEAAGWLTYDPDSKRWQLTESGRERVRVRDDVGRFIADIQTA